MDAHTSVAWMSKPEFVSITQRAPQDAVASRSTADGDGAHATDPARTWCSLKFAVVVLLQLKREE